MSKPMSLTTKITFNKEINYLLKLGDGRICLSYDNTILILNKITFKIEIIKVGTHKKVINSLSQLEDGKLISCANEPILNIYNIGENYLSIAQKIDIFSKIPKDLTKKFKYLFKAAELINKDLAICGAFPILTFYEYNSLKELYDFKYYIHNKTEENIKDFKQINQNQIILVTSKSYSLGCNTRIKLCDLEKKEIKEKSIITHAGKYLGESICKISEFYLAIGVKNSILIFDLKKLKRIKEYNISEYFRNLCVFGNYLFCGTNDGIIYKYAINEDKLELKTTIKQDNDAPIDSLIKLKKKTMVFSQMGTIFMNHLIENN